METRDLCQVCVREVQEEAEGASNIPRRLGAGVGGGTFGRGSLFDEFFADFFDRGSGVGAGSRSPFGGGMGGLGESAPTQRQRAEQVDITEHFSEATNELLSKAAQVAMDWGSPDVDTEHLLHAALHDEVVKHVLEQVGADPAAVLQTVEDEAERHEPQDEMPSLSPDAKRALLNAYRESRELGASYVGPEHVLLALSLDEESQGGELLRRFGLAHTTLRGGVVRGVDSHGAENVTSATKTIDQYSRDLTKDAREGKLDPVIGRGDEIEQTIEILSRRTKNNPVLIGDPGVGKTAIVEGIAQRIVNDDVPETLMNKRVVSVDLAGMVAGTKYRGEFEERLKNAIEEVIESAGELIVFIDELHTVIGAGGAEGAMDAANMLKPALARGELHVVGATTLDEYRRNIEKDAALERRFQPVLVREPTVDETTEILTGLKDRYEAFHRVRITEEAILAAAELSDRYVADRFLPDKAIDLIDQASARVRLRIKTKPEDVRDTEERMRRLNREKDQAVSNERYERADQLRAEVDELQGQLDSMKGGRQRAPEVTVQDIAEVVARATGIPVSQLTQEEKQRLTQMESLLHERVVGQDQAVEAVSEAVRRARAGLADPQRPDGSFLFLGPTGVGKTELARALADVLFGDEQLMTRIDMSEFQERHTVSRLVGAPPGYVGYDEGGQLTEKVRRRPHCVLLLDEIEKAHPDVFNILLQVLEDGRLTDGQGRTVDFSNTVIIMTSNLGSDRILAYAKRQDEKERTFDDLKGELMNLLTTSFRPEFVNRVDEIIVFRALTEPQLLDITRLLVDRVRRRLRGQHIELDIREAALVHLAEIGYDPQFGARPLRRAIQRELENRLSGMILDGSLEPGDRVVVDAKDGRLNFDVEAQARAEEAGTRETAATKG